MTQRDPLSPCDDAPSVDAAPREVFLFPVHLENLAASGLTAETIALAGLYSEVNARTMAVMLNRKHFPRMCGAGLVIPFFTPGNDDAIGYRIRPSNPRVVKRNGKERKVKYEQADGSDALVYLTPRARIGGWYADATRTLYWTEGEKKALVFDQLELACVGLTGVWNWGDGKHKDATGEERLHAHILEHVALADRQHVICFDADAHDNDQVMLAARRLTRLLLLAGVATIKFITPPSKTHKGIDDFYAAFGAEAVLQLLASAGPINPVEPPPQRERADVHNPGWIDTLTRTDRGSIAASVGNIAAILRCDDRWLGAHSVRFDERAQRVMLMPGSPIAKRERDDGSKPREYCDADDARVAVWLETSYGMNLSPTSPKLRGAVEMVALEHSFDPFRDWLAAQQWDGVSRLDGMLRDYLGAANTAANRAFGSMFMIGLVARAFRPASKVDSMLILEGPQGVGKSTFANELAGDDEYFSDSIPPDLGSKDAALHLLGKVIVELGELSALKKTEREALKVFLTKRFDKFRTPYGRRDGVQPRRCGFIGTTNAPAYLQDDTGGRRYWPVEVKACDVHALRRDRAQLWAEARVRFERGEKWWFASAADGDLIHAASELQESKRVSDPWESLIDSYLTKCAHSPGYATVADILTVALKIEPGRQDRGSSTRVGILLHARGWVMRRKTPGGGGARERRYFPADKAPPDDLASNVVRLSIASNPGQAVQRATRVDPYADERERALEAGRRVGAAAKQQSEVAE